MAEENYSNIKLSGSEKIGLISNLATMFSAGIPILEAVDSLLEDVKGPQQKILQTLRDDLIQGKRVWSSFANIPKVATVFSKLKFPLPLPTRALIFMSDLLIQHGIVVLLVFGLLVFVASTIFKMKRDFFMTLIFSLSLILTLVSEI